MSQTRCCGVKGETRYDKRTHHTADDSKVTEKSPITHGEEGKKGNPDCAIILFGIIRHCEHNFQPFPEKSTASIPCTFASFASQNCRY